jgi:hypothetical protein
MVSKKSAPSPTHSRDALMPRWSVDIIRSRAEHLGTVGGRYEKEAIRQAATKFDIPPERQNRIAVTKLSGKGD